MLGELWLHFNAYESHGLVITSNSTIGIDCRGFRNTSKILEQKHSIRNKGQHTCLVPLLWPLGNIPKFQKVSFCFIQNTIGGLGNVMDYVYQRKFRNLTSDYTETCCWRSVNQEMWSRRCDIAEMWDMRIWRVGSARNAVFFHSFVASPARKVRS